MPSTWFITGCSSGLGLELARHALAAGNNVIATSRNPSKTPEAVKEITSSPRGKWLSLDVTASQATITEVITEANGLFPHGIDIVVNNAGYSLLGAFEDLQEEQCRLQLETNYWGPSKIIRAILPKMREKKQGTIVNISSIAGLTALPSCSLYSSSKWALEALSEALSVEVAPFNIRVLLVEPGAFRTNFLSDDASSYVPISEAYKGTPADQSIQKFQAFNGKQYGDVKKGVARIYEFVTASEMLEKKTGFLRLPLGMDCWDRATTQFKKMINNFEEMKEISASTAVEE